MTKEAIANGVGDIPSRDVSKLTGMARYGPLSTPCDEGPFGGTALLLGRVAQSPPFSLGPKISYAPSCADSPRGH